MIRSRGPQKYIALRRLAVWADQLMADSNAELSYFVEGGGELVARCCHQAAHAVASNPAFSGDPTGTRESGAG